MAAEGAENLSPFGGMILSVSLLGNNFQHLHSSVPDENPHDLDGKFWKRHQKMASTLSDILRILPDKLTLPEASQDMKVILLHMNMHASDVCLQETAIQTAKKYHLEAMITRQARARSLVAAEEIVSIMRLTCHVDPSEVHLRLTYFLCMSDLIKIR